MTNQADTDIRLECHSYITETGEANLHSVFDDRESLMSHINRVYDQIPGWNRHPAMTYIVAPYGTAFKYGFSHSKFEDINAWSDVQHERFDREAGL